MSNDDTTTAGSTGQETTTDDTDETMSTNNTTTVSTETETEAEEAIKGGSGVVADGTRAHTEGEGRQTRYFLGGDNARKGEAVEAVLGADEVVDADAGSDDEPEHGTIECEACGRRLGYLTGSHMKSHDDGQPQSVAAYRSAVAARKGVDEGDVPLAPDELTDVFRDAGDHDEETLQELSALNKARWDAGEYDHLRKEDGGSGGAEPVESGWDDTEKAVRRAA